VITSADGAEANELPKLLEAEPLVVAGLDPNPAALGVEPNELEPKLPVGVDTLDVVGVLDPFEPPVVNVGLGNPAGTAD